MHHAICRTFVVVLLAVHSSGFAAQHTCQEIRAAIDIGSGTTKMVVARVNSCTQTIESILAPQPGEQLEVPIEWKKNIEKTADGRNVFSAEIVEAGLAALADLRRTALAHGAQKFSAVATSAFRQLSEGEQTALTTRIREQLAIPVRIISQSEEARLGFLAAIVKLNVPHSDVLVWDIGGGSMQISFWDETTKQVGGYEGQFANNDMQAFVTEQLQHKPRGSDISPNPILLPGDAAKPDNHLRAAILRAEEVAVSTSAAQQRAHMSTIPLIIGIGGVHYYSNCEVTRQSAGCEITRQGLQSDIFAHAHLTDEQLVAAKRAASIEYASKRITAGALTVGFMTAFRFERVRSLKVAVADGILINPGYWP